MTSIEQRDVQSVLAGIDELLPLIAQARPGDRGSAAGARRDRRRTRRGRLLQAAPARAVGWPAVRPDAVLRGGPPARQRLRFHRLGQLDHRRAQLAPRAVRPAGPGRGVGRGPDRAGVLVVRADGRRHRRRRRLPGQRRVALVVRIRPRDLGVPRRPGDQGRQPGRLRQLPDPAQRVPHRRRLARGRPARAPAATPSWSRTCSCRGTASCPTRR